MKKMVLAGVLSLATATSIAADFKPIFLGEDPSKFVGIDSAGRYYVNKNSGFKVVDFSTEISQEDAISNAESMLSSSFPEYQPGFFKNYPNLPDNIEEYSMMGVTNETTEQEYLAISRSYLDSSKSIIRGNRNVYSTDLYYNVLEVRGSQVLITDGKAGSHGTVAYSCNINDFDFSSEIEENLNSCISTPYSYTVNNSGMLLPGMYAAMNDNGIAVVRAKPEEGEFKGYKVKIIDPELGVVESDRLSYEVGEYPDDITISNDDDPFIFLNRDSGSAAYQYVNGELKRVETSESAIIAGGEAFPNYRVFGATKNNIVFHDPDNSSFYSCSKLSANSGDFEYNQYVKGYAKAVGEEGEMLLSNYPNRPENYAEIVVSLGIEDDFPVDANDEEFQELVDGFLMPGFEEGKDKKIEILGCETGTLNIIDDNVGGLLLADNSGPGSELFFYMKNLRKDQTLKRLPLIVSYDLNGKEKKFISKEIVEAIGINDHFIRKSIESVEEGYAWLDFMNIQLPEDPSSLNLIDDISLEEFTAYVYDLVLSHNPLGRKSAIEDGNVFQNPFFVEFYNGVIASSAGTLTLSSPIVSSVDVTAKPKASLIDPYTNPVSSIDIVTNGGLFAADVSCTVAGPMDITSADYGNWGGSERLTLPLQWKSKDAKGIVSLKGDVDSVSGEQQLLVLDTLAEVTTADVTVNCAATVSDKNGNQINVNLIPATIRLDDGIHGGTGVITGQVTLPAGVNSEDVTVEVTLNGRTIRLNVDENGRFEFDELRDGDFTINVKSEHYTQSCINTQTTGNQIDLGNIELIAGDVNNDGEINIADFTYLAGRYGSAKGDDRYTTQADLNSDEKVNIQDLAILGSHFGSRQCNP